MVWNSTGADYRLNAAARIVTPVVAIQRGRERVTYMIGEDGLNIFGRRQFLGVAVGAPATTQLVPDRPANAGLVLDRPIEVAQSEVRSSATSLKQIDAGVLNVGYVDAGPVDGPAVILLHGWPYDIHSFGEVTPRLASAGFRVHCSLCAGLRVDVVPVERNP